MGPFREMRRVPLEPHAATYNSAIRASEKARSWEGALVLLCRMRSGGLPPDLITFSAGRGTSGPRPAAPS